MARLVIGLLLISCRGCASRSLTSQGRQDSIFSAVFERIGETNRFFVEFGFNAASYEGGTGANTAALWKRGWRGLLLDSKYENATINLHTAFVTSQSVASTFAAHRVPAAPDLVSIDIDTADLWVMRSILAAYRPRVVAVEYNPNFALTGLDAAAITMHDPATMPTLHGASTWSYTCFMGASSRALFSAASAHGYKLVATAAPFDLIFVRGDLWPDGSAALDDSTEALTRPVPLHRPMSAAEAANLVDYDTYLATSSVCDARASAAQTLRARANEYHHARERGDVARATELQCFQRLRDLPRQPAGCPSPAKTPAHMPVAPSTPSPAMAISGGSPPGPQRRVAVCLVGQLRSIARTAESLRRNLLEHWEADGFVVATTDHDDAPSAIDRAHVKLLGPRVVDAVLGASADILDGSLLDRLAAAPLHELSFVDMQDPSKGMAQRYASQLLHGKACHARVMHAEATRGSTYDVYVRMRLDTALFEPMPSRFLAAVSAPDVAVVPSGEDFGADSGGADGLNDRVFVGGALAFAADSSRWLALLQNTLNITSPWILETLTRDSMAAAGVTVRREPLAYCLLHVDGWCKYLGELAQAARIQTDLLARQPLLCGRLLATSGSRAGSDLEPANCNPHRTTVLQSAAMRADDPGFCQLEMACRGATPRSMLADIAPPERHRPVERARRAMESGTAGCSNTCSSSYMGMSPIGNGMCSDGGPGSSSVYNEVEPCPLGTDCDDCGLRVMPPFPPSVPLPPVTPPNPPSQPPSPPGVCSNSCRDSYGSNAVIDNGECTDGGDGSSDGIGGFQMCDYGTDCADCGPRWIDPPPPPNPRPPPSPPSPPMPPSMPDAVVSSMVALQNHLSCLSGTCPSRIIIADGEYTVTSTLTIRRGVTIEAATPGHPMPRSNSAHSTKASTEG